MAQQIIALDIGAWEVKALVLDLAQKPRITQCLRQRVMLGSTDPPPPAPEQPGQAASDFVPPTPEAQPVEAPAAQGPKLEPWQLAVSELLERLELEGEFAVVTNLHGQDALSVQVDGLTFSDRSKVAKILPSQLSERLPMPLDTIVYDFDVVPKPVETYEAIVGFARRATMGAFLAQLLAIDLEPNLVGIPELMMRHLAARLPHDGDGAYAVLDIGHIGSELTVMSQGHIVTARTIAAGGAGNYRAHRRNLRRLARGRRARQAPAGLLGTRPL